MKHILRMLTIVLIILVVTGGRAATASAKQTMTGQGENHLPNFTSKNFYQ